MKTMIESKGRKELDTGLKMKIVSERQRRKS
jgi:hypothetical protein